MQTDGTTTTWSSVSWQLDSHQRPQQRRSTSGGFGWWRFEQLSGGTTPVTPTLALGAVDFERVMARVAAMPQPAALGRPPAAMVMCLRQTPVSEPSMLFFVTLYSDPLDLLHSKSMFYVFFPMMLVMSEMMVMVTAVGFHGGAPPPIMAAIFLFRRMSGKSRFSLLFSFPFLLTSED
ncbi:hypothetical protein HanPSC8_Chr09g0366611 [Helianthus annuus]|nr:hypothetical protein HanPSC8_Chr09g0366611 [Helianthus annuus]